MKTAARCKLTCTAALVAACSPDPVDDYQTIARAIVAGDLTAVVGRVHPDYTDEIGDRTRLAADLRALAETHPKIAITLSELEAVPAANPALGDDLIGRQEIHLSGRPEWKVIGPVAAEYRRAGQLRLRSGLLDDLRDVMGLMAARRAALEANDADAYAALLHPGYKDGDLDKDGAVERIRRDLDGIRIRHEPVHYRVEIRGPLAHVDERFVFTAAEKTFPSTVARLTLERSAGRWRVSSGLYRSGIGLEPEGGSD